ncbi:hypothetical protein EDD85DRAFT_941509 [Armillaria nabsnona]|nr:hypothetical protein EDD85DRAFT_941509 [Armillaria nabsnona]
MKRCTFIVSISDEFFQVWVRMAVMVRDQVVTIKVAFLPPSLWPSKGSFTVALLVRDGVLERVNEVVHADPRDFAIVSLIDFAVRRHCLENAERIVLDRLYHCIQILVRCDRHWQRATQCVISAPILPLVFDPDRFIPHDGKEEPTAAFGFGRPYASYNSLSGPALRVHHRVSLSSSKAGPLNRVLLIRGRFRVFQCLSKAGSTRVRLWA